jgi:hypothetical protein
LIGPASHAGKVLAETDGWVHRRLNHLFVGHIENRKALNPNSQI